jgi:acetoin utilization deacetylase AcuC-like enzyme
MLSDPRFALHHAPGPHPERPERLIAAQNAAARVQEQRGETWTRIAPRGLTAGELARVHSARLTDTLQQWKGRAGFLDGDTFVSTESVDLALEAAGGVVDMAQALMQGPHRQGVALLRPPGHHATRDRSMGFCLVNHVALAARAVQGRVAIVDFDVHHGNGTEDIFRDDPNVLYISTHQYPLYPGTGNLTAVGEKDGLGYTVNIPLNEGGGDGVYRAAFERIVLPVIDEFAPALILVSAGFDASSADPLAQMSLSADAFGWMSHALRECADKHAEGRMALVLEGGYDLPSLESGLAAALHGMLGTMTYQIARDPDALDVAHAATSHQRRWKSVQ